MTLRALRAIGWCCFSSVSLPLEGYSGAVELSPPCPFPNVPNSRCVPKKGEHQAWAPSGTSLSKADGTGQATKPYVLELRTAVETFSCPFFSRLGGVSKRHSEKPSLGHLSCCSCSPPWVPPVTEGTGNHPVANVPSPAVLPVCLWDSSFSWQHLTLPSVTLLDQGTDISHGILRFLEAVAA